MQEALDLSFDRLLMMTDDDVIINIYKRAQVRKNLYSFKIKILNLKIPLLIFTFSCRSQGSASPILMNHIALQVLWPSVRVLIFIPVSAYPRHVCSKTGRTVPSLCYARTWPLLD